MAYNIATHPFIRSCFCHHAHACLLQVAFQQADYVAWNLWACISKRPLLPFKYQHLGDMMSLGRTSGAVTLPIPVPPPLQQAANNAVFGSLLSLAGIQ